MIPQLREQTAVEVEGHGRAVAADLAGAGEAVRAGEVAGAGRLDAKPRRPAAERRPHLVPLPREPVEVQPAPDGRPCPLELRWRDGQPREVPPNQVQVPHLPEPGTHGFVYTHSPFSDSSPPRRAAY